MGRLEDQVAIVTGGTSGIGRACASAFLREGAHVVIAGRRRATGSALAASLGARSRFVAADVTREDDIEHLAATVLERFGRIDCVISSAGATSATGAIADTDPKAFEDLSRVCVPLALQLLQGDARGATSSSRTEPTRKISTRTTAT
jgi:NAD(P)-dependent dehydrogenase (short-subunit alcohol dehydrogenase family)